MLRKNNGFFLAELLLTLSVLLVIAGVFFPLIIHAVGQSVKLQQEYEATQLLYEYLQGIKTEGTEPGSETIKREQAVYEINLDSINGNGQLEVCIEYEDIFRKEHKKCEIYE